MPSFYTGLGEKGEIMCLTCDIDYLNEAMPFDKIFVYMYLETIYECGVDLRFEFFLLDKSVIKKKLAYAKHKVIWVKWDKFANPIPSKWPNEVLKQLVKYGSSA